MDTCHIPLFKGLHTFWSSRIAGFMLCLLVLSSRSGFSQSNIPLEELKQLTGDSLVSLALLQLEADGFDPDNIRTFQIKFARKEDDDVVVFFDHYINFVPRNTNSIRQLSVHLMANRLGWMEMENGGGEELTKHVYEYQDKDWDLLKKLLGAKYDEDELDLEVYEAADHYVVNESTDYYMGSYKISKETGEIYDESYDELDPAYSDW